MVCLPCKSCKPPILPNGHFPFALLDILFHQDFFFITLVQGITLLGSLCYSSSWFSMLGLTRLRQCWPIFSSFSFLMPSLYLLSYIPGEQFLHAVQYSACYTSHEVWCKHLPFCHYLKATILFFAFSQQKLDT